MSTHFNDTDVHSRALPARFADDDVRFSERTVERYIQRWSGGEFVTDRVVVPARRLL